jgi:thioredoxin 1
MTLHTNLEHLVTGADVEKTINSNENVMVCCGRMGPMCVPVYGIMEDLQKSGKYDHVAFRDMAFDSPEAAIIRNLPECRGFMGLPFTVYYKNGKVAAATTSIQNLDQVIEILDAEFSK